MKISRMTISSLTFCSRSGVRVCGGRPGCWVFRIWSIMASARALGTALPLTMAMFCANTEGAASVTVAASTAALAIREIFMMSEKLSVEGSDGLGFDRQGMHAMRNQIAQSIIHKAVALHVRQSVEAAPPYLNGEMRAD